MNDETQVYKADEAIAIIDRFNAPDNYSPAPIGTFKADALKWIDDNADKLATSIYTYLNRTNRSKKADFVNGFRYGCEEMIRRIYQ